MPSLEDLEKLGMSTIIGLDEDLPVTAQHDIYPFIDPAEHYGKQTFRGKVALITGASRGIGQETAIQFAKAGANVVIVARKQTTLDETKDAVLKVKPDAQVLTFPADVTDTARAEAAIKATMEKFGRLDVLVANAGFCRPADSQKPFTENDPLVWWKTLEVNLRGVYNYVHYAIPELKKTKGTIIATSSMAAMVRMPSMSDYSISKHALNRFIEYVALENPDIPAFSVHPGTVGTEMFFGSVPKGMQPEDSVALPAAVFLHLASGRAAYLSGRYVSATWDLEQVERKWKDKIAGQNGLVAKLSIPV